MPLSFSARVKGRFDDSISIKVFRVWTPQTPPPYILGVDFDYDFDSGLMLSQSFVIIPMAMLIYVEISVGWLGRRYALLEESIEQATLLLVSKLSHGNSEVSKGH